MASGIPDEVGQDRVVPYVFPTRGPGRRPPGARADRGPRPGRALVLRHDDPGRSGHLDGRPGRGRRRPDRRRPGGRRRDAERVRAVPPTGAPREPRRRSAARATSTTRPSRPRRCAGPATTGSRSSTSTPTTATARRRCSTTAATCSTPRCTSTPGPAGSRTTSASPTRPAPATATGATLNVPLAPGSGRRGLARRRRPAGRRRHGARRDRAGRLARAWTPRCTTRRARCRSRPRGTPRPAGGSPRSACPPSHVQEGGYHLPTIGELVVAFLWPFEGGVR